MFTRKSMVAKPAGAVKAQRRVWRAAVLRAWLRPLTRPRGPRHTRAVPRSSRFGPRIAAVAIALFAAAAGPRLALADRAGEAEMLYRRSVDLESRGSVEARREAMQCLERATALDPEHLDYQLALGRLYYRMGFLKQARRRFERAGKLDDGSPDARFGLGQVWRRDWLKYLDHTSLGRAVDHFTAAARLRPGDSECWLQLVPVLYEQDSLAAAAAAAERALAAAPNRPEAKLAVAYTSFRLGRIARAESTFVAAFPDLPRIARERFEDIGPLASERDTATLRKLPPEGRAEFLRRFWREHDPDLASLENEAQLEYWARVAQAYFLFFDSRRRQWDERGEVYVRYGAPERAEYNPLGLSSIQFFGTGPGYPVNNLVWSYPGLGMQVQMQDRLLSEYYLLPIDLYADRDPRPDPAALARRDDLLSSRGGRGVFPMLPPKAEPRAVDAVLARFSGERGPRLFGQIQTAGGPDEGLVAEWVVLDTAMAEVARARREPG
ncbi:MAG: GWxTD domain-containing protein, partial [Candidatus Eiseniibacteriota bacterium]